MQTPTLPIHFAPLQGYTEAPYREAHQQLFGGITTYTTPFVRLEKGEFRRKDLRDIDPGNNLHSQSVPQILASTPEEVEKMVKLFITLGYHKADINMGCPFPPLAKRRKGAGILAHPDAVNALLEVITRFPEMEFSIKMRPGWDNAEQGLKLLPLLNQIPLTHITLHSRLGIQQYKGKNDPSLFRLFYEQSRHPLIYNGDIRTCKEIHQIQDSFPHIAGVMIGRGLLANPALAREYQQGCPYLFSEKKEKLHQLHEEVLQSYTQHIEGGEAQLVSKMKPFWEYMETGSRKALKAIHKSRDLSAYRRAVDAWRKELEMTLEEE